VSFAIVVNRSPPSMMPVSTSGCPRARGTGREARSRHSVDVLDASRSRHTQRLMKRTNLDPVAAKKSGGIDSRL
jgi:hypothetical protein